ncbi:hypothetical protein COO60DRAFT_638140 [Scenedesmus sp. NREL 46B-D3]|nr:hypothetical protein COO60DRAFT_638140 [Scenedesmus sp. NREL 46B-D3]
MCFGALLCSISNCAQLWCLGPDTLRCSSRVVISINCLELLDWHPLIRELSMLSHGNACRREQQDTATSAEAAAGLGATYVPALVVATHRHTKTTARQMGLSSTSNSDLSAGLCTAQPVPYDTIWYDTPAYVTTCHRHLASQRSGL